MPRRNLLVLFLVMLVAVLLSPAGGELAEPACWAMP